MYIIEIATLTAYGVDNIVRFPVSSYADAITFAIGYADGEPFTFREVSEEDRRVFGADFLATVTP